MKTHPCRLSRWKLHYFIARTSGKIRLQNWPASRQRRFAIYEVFFFSLTMCRYNLRISAVEKKALVTIEVDTLWIIHYIILSIKDILTFQFEIFDGFEKNVPDYNLSGVIRLTIQSYVEFANIIHITANVSLRYHEPKFSYFLKYFDFIELYCSVVLL